ncbi:MAG: hypothetical protein ACYC35_12425 [Pirellulales bacterium]
MNVDRILEMLNRREVAYLLIGGMNFLLRHAPVLTFDIDLWIADTAENLDRCERALGELDAQWGPTEQDWGPVAGQPAGWLRRQGVYCLTSRHGAIDIFRAVKGLDSWEVCRARAEPGATSAGTAFLALADEDMLRCQLALPEAERRLDRIRALREKLGGNVHG